MTLFYPVLAAAPGAQSAWSPWLVGALIGVLVMLTMYISNHPIGASGAYDRIAGLIGLLIAPLHTRRLKQYKDNPPTVDWETMLVLFVALGALLAAWHGGELTGRWLAPIWEARFGDSILLRSGIACLGGIIMAFGARLAGGCTSGHGISGALQLSVGSWLALLSFFAGGILTAGIMF